MRLLEENEEPQVTEVTEVTAKSVFSYTGPINEKDTGNSVTKVTKVTKAIDISDAPRPVPDSDDLSSGELGKMLEDFAGMTLEKIIAMWKEVGGPSLSLGPGIKVDNLEVYLKLGFEFSSIKRGCQSEKGRLL